MVDTMFRRYGFAGVQVQIQAVLTLYSQGELSCLPTLITYGSKSTDVYICAQAS